MGRESIIIALSRLLDNGVKIKDIVLDGGARDSLLGTFQPGQRSEV